MDNTQLPAEVVKNIKYEANKIYWETHNASRDRDPYCMGLTMFEVAQIPIINALTEYAAKLHQAEQELKQLKQWQIEAIAVLDPILEYGRSKEAGIPLGKSITNTVLERCKQFDAARALLEKFISRHEAGLLPDRLLYNEIKTFWDGTR